MVARRLCSTSSISSNLFNREKVADTFNEINRKKPKRSSNGSTAIPKIRKSMIDKLEEEDYNSFTSGDILEYFIVKAEEAGVKYVPYSEAIDKRNINSLIKKGYSKEEVLMMISFVFSGDQTYLDVKRMHVGILISKWSNTIYRDSQLWLDDKYVDRKYTKSKPKESSIDLSKREWSSDSDSTSKTVIGGWD